MTGTIASLRSCAIGRLRLFRFRNYAEATVHLGPSLNVISGRNAQGKTNLLEAVATLTLTRSPRTSSASDLMRWGDEQCLVEAAISRSSGDSVLAVRFTREPDTARVSRTTSVDGKPCPEYHDKIHGLYRCSGPRTCNWSRPDPRAGAGSSMPF